MVLILGAAGRDFHNFNLCFRDDPGREVVGFTAAQIPGIENRTYPPELSGSLYPRGLPIWPEIDPEKIIEEKQVNWCVLAYSDLSHFEVMETASRVLAAGANFGILGWHQTALRSQKPVIAVCAVKAGCDKSQTSRNVVGLLREAGLDAMVVRHPMPYGDLTREAVQRFASSADLEEMGEPRLRGRDREVRGREAPASRITTTP